MDRRDEPARRELQACRQRYDQERRLPGLRFLHPQLSDALGQRSRQPDEQSGPGRLQELQVLREGEAPVPVRNLQHLQPRSFRGSEQRSHELQFWTSEPCAAELAAYDSDGVETIVLMPRGGANKVHHQLSAMGM